MNHWNLDDIGCTLRPIYKPNRSLSSTIGVMYRKSIWVMGAPLSYWALQIDLGKCISMHWVFLWNPNFPSFPEKDKWKKNGKKKRVISICPYISTFHACFCWVPRVPSTLFNQHYCSSCRFGQGRWWSHWYRWGLTNRNITSYQYSEGYDSYVWRNRNRKEEGVFWFTVRCLLMLADVAIEKVMFWIVLKHSE